MERYCKPSEIHPISICYTSRNIMIRRLKVKVSYKILERILSNSRYFGKQKHSCRHKFSREFSKRCAFSVNLLSTSVNLKTGCKPDVQRVLTTCQPITQKNSSIKRETQKSKSKDLGNYFYTILSVCFISQFPFQLQGQICLAAMINFL